MLKIQQFKKSSLLMQTLLLLVSFFMLFYILDDLMPIYKFGLLSTLSAFYLLLLYSQYAKRQRPYEIARIAIVYLSILIGIITVIALVSSFIILVNREGLVNILTQNSLGKWIYFLICFLQPIVLPLPEPVTIMSGSAAFGSTYGFLLGFSGTILGIFTTFWLARIGGGKLVRRIVDSEQHETYKKFVAKSETLILLGLFILPILPDEVICVGAGVSVVRFKKFAIIAILAKLITTYSYSQSIELTQFFDIPTHWLIIVCLAVLPITVLVNHLRHRVSKKFRNSAR